MIQFELFLENIIAQFGLSIVLFILLSKGLLIGKPLPAILTISTYAILTGYTSIQTIIILCLITSLATTTGELIIFLQCKYPNHKFSKYLPNKIKNTTENNKNNGYITEKINKLFNKLSNNIGLTIFIGNIITGIRGLASIIAGRKQYSTYKFFILSYISTFIYHTVLTYSFITGFSIIF